jgi:hypothetical protein
MKILFSSGLVFAGMVSLPYVSQQKVFQDPATESRRDPRLDALRMFFAKFDCPAERLSSHFVQAADDYGLDWRLLPSISYIESSGGKWARNNNFFGWDSGRAEFASPEAGIHVVGYRLAHSKLYRGKDLDGLLATYNPNAEYARKVKSVMRRISPAE